MKISRTTDRTAPLTRALDAAQQIKERKVAEHQDNPDVPSTVITWRGDQLVAIAQSPHVSRDDLLMLANICSMGFSAEVLVLVQETYKSEVELNPLTGLQWAPGELQDVAEHHDGLGQHWVTEALMVMCYDRQGGYDVVELPYRITGGHVTWDRSLDTDDPKIKTFGGFIHETLLAIMAQDDLLATAQNQFNVSPADFGLSTEQGLAHGDAALTKMLCSDGFPGLTDMQVLLCADPGTERADALIKSLGADYVIRGDDL